MRRHLSRVAAMLRRWRHRDKTDQTLNAELEAFLQQDIDARIGEGMTREDARRSARVALGGVTEVVERTRDARTGVRLEALVRDARYAARTFLCRSRILWC